MPDVKISVNLVVDWPSTRLRSVELLFLDSKTKSVTVSPSGKELPFLKDAPGTLPSKVSTIW